MQKTLSSLCLAFLLLVGCKSNKDTGACPQGLTSCGGQCTATQVDPANCGACGTACPAGQLCSVGACSATCATGYSACTSGATGYCADFKKDAQNCGACGKACPAGQLCAMGTCGAGCSAGTMTCTQSGAAYCANPQTDAQNCGRCGNKCPLAGETCVAGACKCGFTALSVANAYTCAVKTDGSVACWGALNNYNTMTVQTYYPTVVAGLGSIQSLAGGNQFMCALKTDGTVWCWGYGADGELGNNASTFSATPVQVMDSPSTTLGSVTQLAVGHNNGCALKSNGEVWCWGENNEAQLGTGATGGNSLVAVKATTVAALAVTIASVAVGQNFACARTSTGAVYCWGQNDSGQTGNGNTGSPQLTPVLLTGLTASELVLGDQHACALKSDGSLSCWGRNSNGEVGNGTTTTPVTSPTAVLAAAATPLTGIAHVVVGSISTCALKTDGTVWCWGGNDHAQLGNNLADGGVAASYPTQVMLTAGTPPTDLTSVTQLVLRDRHPCALVGDHAYCWGSNHKAQIEIGPADVSMATATSCGQ